MAIKLGQRWHGPLDLWYQRHALNFLPACGKRLCCNSYPKTPGDCE